MRWIRNRRSCRTESTGRFSVVDKDHEKFLRDSAVLEWLRPELGKLFQGPGNNREEQYRIDHAGLVVKTAAAFDWKVTSIDSGRSKGRASHWTYRFTRNL